MRVLSGVLITLFLIIASLAPCFAQTEPQDTTTGPARFGWIAYPYVFLSPETNWAFGVGGFVFFRFSPDSTVKPSSITPSGYYSVNDQFDITVIPEFYIGKKFYVYSYFSFGNYIDKFYGIGNATPEIGNPEYDHESIVAQLNLQPQISETFRAGLYTRYLHRIILDARTNPFLSDASIPGTSGGVSLGFGGVFAWDTRDHRFYPTSGILNELRAVYYSKSLGSDFDYNKYELDLRGYHSIDEEKKHIIGMQFYAVSTTSGTPFYDMALLGSKTIMRGYYQGRYRDQFYLAAQAEYRTNLFWRIGAVGFLGVGEVMRGIKEFELKNLLPNYGFGLRYQFDVVEKLDIRVDVGFGKNTSGVYFDVQQAF